MLAVNLYNYIKLLKNNFLYIFALLFFTGVLPSSFLFFYLLFFNQQKQQQTATFCFKLAMIIFFPHYFEVLSLNLSLSHSLLQIDCSNIIIFPGGEHFWKGRRKFIE